MRAQLADDPATRARELAIADEAIRYLETLNGRVSRAAWYMARAQGTSDQKAAQRDLDLADRDIIETMKRTPTSEAALWVLRGQLEQLRCRLVPHRCQPSRIDAYFDRAVMINPLMRGDVTHARATALN